MAAAGQAVIETRNLPRPSTRCSTRSTVATLTTVNAASASWPASFVTSDADPLTWSVLDRSTPTHRRVNVSALFVLEHDLYADQQCFN